MKLFRTFAGTLAVLFSLIGSNAALAAAETNISNGLTLKGPGLAVHGYDVVAYFTDGRPTVGRATFSTVHNAATYGFASNAHLNAFEADPERYVPQYGGYYAYGVSAAQSSTATLTCGASSRGSCS